MVMSVGASETRTLRPGMEIPAGHTLGEEGQGDFYIKFDDNMTIEDVMQQLRDNYNYTDRFYDDWKMDWDILHDDRWKAMVVVIYVLVIVFGCAANVLIVVVIVRYRQLHTVTNVFIVGLGLADIALCLFNLPLQLHYQLNDHWSFGKVLCSVAMTTFGVPMFASSLFILMIAVDRYLLIVHPFKRRMTVRCAMLLAAAIVLVTLGLAVPLMVFTHLVVLQEDLVQMHKIYCTETWPSLLAKQVYSVTCFLLQFVLPLVFTTIFYTHICLVLRNRPIKKHDTRRNQRTNRILMAVVLTFTVCWLPWNLFVLTAEFNHQLVKGKFFRFTDLLLKIFAMGSACVNPFLYGWLNDNFKKELGKMLGYNTLCCRQPGRQREDGLSMGYFSKTTNVGNHTGGYSPAEPLKNMGSYNFTEPLNHSGGYSPTEPLNHTGGYSPTEPLNHKGGYNSTEPLNHRGGYSPTEPLNHKGGYSYTEPYSHNVDYRYTDPFNHKGGYSPTESLNHTEGYSPAEPLKHMVGYSPAESVNHTEAYSPTESLNHTGGYSPNEALNHTEGCSLADLPNQKESHSYTDPLNHAEGYGIAEPLKHMGGYSSAEPLNNNASDQNSPV